MEFLITALALGITGMIAGLASGMIGVGGCFIMVPVQYWLLSAGGLDTTLATRVAFGTGIAVTLPTVISAAAGHHKRGAVDWETAIPMGLAATMGAVVGGTLAASLPGSVLRSIFALLVTFVAIRMVTESNTASEVTIHISLPLLLLIGFGIGNITSLAGIGGGVILIPILTGFLHFSVHRAIGTSAACLIFSSAGATISYIWQGAGVVGLPAHTIGYIDPVQWILLAGTTIPFSMIGVRYAHQCPACHLRNLLAGLMMVIGILMLISSG